MGNHLFSIFPKWYGSEFISALGGALSLYLGISLAMFFELMEFFIVLFKNVWGYALKGRKHSEEKSAFLWEFEVKYVVFFFRSPDGLGRSKSANTMPLRNARRVPKLPYYLLLSVRNLYK